MPVINELLFKSAKSFMQLFIDVSTADYIYMLSKTHTISVDMDMQIENTI